METRFALILFLVVIWCHVDSNKDLTREAWQESTPSESLEANMTTTWTDCSYLTRCDSEERLCHCDAICSLYGDCCPVVKNESESNNGLIEEVSRIPDFAECIHLYGNQIWIVNRCPSEENHECFHPENRSDIDNLLPVTDKYNISYRNAQCAKCHGSSDLALWRATFSPNRRRSCNTMGHSLKDLVASNYTSKEFATYMLDKGCEFKAFPPSNVPVRRCVPDMIKTEGCSKSHVPLVNVITDEIHLNRDCCSQMHNNCDDEKVFFCNAFRKFNDPFNSMEVRIDSLPSTIFFEFSKGMQQIAYANIGFFKTVDIKTEALVNRETLYSLFCVLRHYFLQITDALVVDVIRVSLSTVTFSSNDMYYNYSGLHFEFELHSKRLFRNVDDIDQLQEWLEELVFRYTEITYGDDKLPKQFLRLRSDNLIYPVENVTESTTYQILAQGRVIHHLDLYIRKRSKVCKVLKTGTALIPSPQHRCHQLQATVLIYDEDIILVWNCTETKESLAGNHKSYTSSTTRITHYIFLLCLSSVSLKLFISFAR